MKEFENDLAMGHPEIFYAEVLNDENATVNNLIDLSKLPRYPYEDNDIPGGNFVMIDPSNDKANSDAVSIGYFEIHNGYPVLRKLVEGRLSPGDTIREALTLALTYGSRLIAIESNGYQYSLNYWFKFICEQMGISGIEAVEVYSGQYSKVSRIITMLKSYLKGEIWVHPDCKAAVHLQITSFNPLKRDNTDGLLDLLTYAPRILEMYGDYIAATAVIPSQDFNAVSVPSFNSPF
jgi:hypothetical protein